MCEMPGDRASPLPDSRVLAIQETAEWRSQMITEFSHKLFESLKRFGAEALEFKEYYRSDQYIQGAIDKFLNCIPRFPDFEWYDNPALKEVGQAMGYATSRQFYEAVRSAQFDEAIKEER
jgi:hypothetical protein